MRLTSEHCISGGVTSRTSTDVEQVAVRPPTSLAVHVMAVVPRENEVDMVPVRKVVLPVGVLIKEMLQLRLLMR